MESISIILGFFLGKELYTELILLTILTMFIPFIIAIIRKHSQKWLIFFMVVITAWTIIFWFIALIWALIPFKKVKEFKVELSVEEKLARLNKLLGNNCITEDEYKNKRTQIFKEIVNKKT